MEEMKRNETALTTSKIKINCISLVITYFLPVYYYILSPSTRTPAFPLLPAVFAHLQQIYEVPTLPHIQTKYIVYNVVRGVTKQKLEIRITPY
jgi:hypothetical protein